MVDEFLKVATRRIETYENNLRVLQDKYKQLGNEIPRMETKIELMHEMIREYMDAYNITSITPTNFKLGSFANKSYPQMLIEIAKNSNGILQVSDAVDILLKENVGNDKKVVQRNVYSAMSRLKDHFVRIKTGQYRFTNHIQIGKKPKQGNSRGEPSGVRQAVKSLKETNPQMTPKEILNHLKEIGFDFKGKKPTNSVNMAWVNLGYSKEGKQQPLPITNVATETQVPPESQSKHFEWIKIPDK